MPAYQPGETPPPDQVYDNFSSQETLAAQASLNALAANVTEVYPADGVSFLALSQDRDISGYSAPVHGMVGVQSRLLAHPEISVFLGIHEAVHARLGGAALRQEIDRVAPGYQDYLRRGLIPAWLNGYISFERNDEYLRSRRWDGLYPFHWDGPQAVTPGDARGTVGNYFSLIARDQIAGFAGHWIHTDTRFPGAWGAAMEQPVLPAHEAFGDRQEWLARLMLTGYQMGEDLRRYVRDNNRNYPDVDMWECEEGFANYVAHGLTGVPLEAVQEVAPQDPGKLALARRFIATGVPAQVVVDTVRDYTDLFQFMQTHLQP